MSGSQTCACTHGIGRMCASRRSGESALPYGCDRQMAPCSVLQYELMKLGQSTRDAMQWSSGLRGSPHLMVHKIDIFGGNPRELVVLPESSNLLNYRSGDTR